MTMPTVALFDIDGTNIDVNAVRGWSQEEEPWQRPWPFPTGMEFRPHRGGASGLYRQWVLQLGDDEPLSCVRVRQSCHGAEGIPAPFCHKVGAPLDLSGIFWCPGLSQSRRPATVDPIDGLALARLVVLTPRRDGAALDWTWLRMQLRSRAGSVRPAGQRDEGLGLGPDGVSVLESIEPGDG